MIVFIFKIKLINYNLLICNNLEKYSICTKYFWANYLLIGSISGRKNAIYIDGS
jgi:hypothetical protein